MLSEGDLSSDKIHTLRRRSRNHMTVLTVNRKVHINEDAQVLFTISVCSEQCDYSVKRQRLYYFIFFAQNMDIHLSRKSTKLDDWLIMGSQLLAQ